MDGPQSPEARPLLDHQLSQAQDFSSFLAKYMPRHELVDRFCVKILLACESGHYSQKARRYPFDNYGVLDLYAPSNIQASNPAILSTNGINQSFQIAFIKI